MARFMFIVFAFIVVFSCVSFCQQVSNEWQVIPVTLTQIAGLDGMEGEIKTFVLLNTKTGETKIFQWAIEPNFGYFKVPDIQNYKFVKPTK